MNDFSVAAAVAEAHRADLLQEAQQHRRIRAAKASSRRPRATPLRRLFGWLRTLLPGGKRRGSSDYVEAPSGVTSNLSV